MMGWRPRDVYECSVLEFAAAFSGWQRFHAAQVDEPMTHADLDALISEHGVPEWPMPDQQPIT